MQHPQDYPNTCKSQLPQCAARRRFLDLERGARLRIGKAERDSETIPMKQIAAFRKRQEDRWRHEDSCPLCRKVFAAA